MNTDNIEHRTIRIERVKRPYNNVICYMPKEKKNGRERERKGLHECGSTNSKSHSSHLVAEHMCSQKEGEGGKSKLYRKRQRSNDHVIHTDRSTTVMFAFSKQLFNSQLSIGGY